MHQLARIRATFSLGLILLTLIILLSIFVPGLSANGKTISNEQTRNLRKSGVAKKRLSAGVPSVQIDNGTSLDPYKDSYLFKRQIIFLLLPNYLNRIGAAGGGGLPYGGGGLTGGLGTSGLPSINSGLTPGLTPGMGSGFYPGAGVNPGYFGAPALGNGVFRTPAGGASGNGRGGFRKPAHFTV